MTFVLFLFRCLDLQQKKKEKTSKSKDGKLLKRQKITSGCPYMNENNIEQLKEEAIVEIHDVENLVALGKELIACPYYGARATVLDSQIVVIPYNILLHKSTRKASGKLIYCPKKSRDLNFSVKKG